MCSCSCVVARGAGRWPGGLVWTAREQGVRCAACLRLKLRHARPRRRQLGALQLALVLGVRPVRSGQRLGILRCAHAKQPRTTGFVHGVTCAAALAEQGRQRYAANSACAAPWPAPAGAAACRRPCRASGAPPRATRRRAWRRPAPSSACAAPPPPAATPGQASDAERVGGKSKRLGCCWGGEKVRTWTCMDSALCCAARACATWRCCSASSRWHARRLPSTCAADTDRRPCGRVVRSRTAVRRQAERGIAAHLQRLLTRRRQVAGGLTDLVLCLLVLEESLHLQGRAPGRACEWDACGVGWAPSTAQRSCSPRSPWYPRAPCAGAPPRAPCLAATAPPAPSSAARWPPPPPPAAPAPAPRSAAARSRAARPWRPRAAPRDAPLGGRAPARLSRRKQPDRSDSARPG